VPAGGPEDLAKVWEAYEVLQERYVDRQSLDKEKLAEGAIRGMIATLDDPFTSYFPPRRYQENLELFEGAFQGIGAQVAIRDGHVTVVSPIPDTPADKAGLRAGDIILAVEDQSVEGLTLDEVIDRIRGPKGTPVRLRILQAQTNRIMDLRIVRDEIKNATVTYGLLEGPIARVRLTQFVERTDEDLIRALDELKDQKVRGIVLDLRNNPGGLLRVVIRVASQFLDKGLVLYEVDASGTRTDHAVQGGGDAKTIPLVVLVNGGSASGSEVVAGALQDQRRAVIIGTQTFGKGVVNTPIRLSDGSGMIVTTARWYTPNGRQIGKVGITPDVLVERTPEDIAAGRDPQLAKALELLTLQSNAGRSAWGAGTQAGEQRTGLGVEAVRAG
jgi:carboxyl-terminal processing protease